MAEIDISIEVDDQFRVMIDEKLLLRVSMATLAAESVSGPATLSVLVTDDEAVRRLNAQYLGEDTPTDVLAFPTGEADEEFVLPPDEPHHLGDVIIACPTAQRQAAEQGHSLQREIAHLLVHGILHLLGYDHVEPGDARRMHGREEEIIAPLRL